MIRRIFPHYPRMRGKCHTQMTQSLNQTKYKCAPGLFFSFFLFSFFFFLVCKDHDPLSSDSALLSHQSLLETRWRGAIKSFKTDFIDLRHLFPAANDRIARVSQKVDCDFNNHLKFKLDKIKTFLQYTTFNEMFLVQL